MPCFIARDHNVSYTNCPSDECDQNWRNHSVSYTNCTIDEFDPNWTELCCQRKAVKDLQIINVTMMSFFIMLGSLSNMATIFSFLYLLIFFKRIQRIFSQTFSITKDPVFFLILNLSVCDLIYCTVGLAPHWLVYYYQYFPLSNTLCKYTAVIRTIAGKKISCRFMIIIPRC